MNKIKTVAILFLITILIVVLIGCKNSTTTTNTLVSTTSTTTTSITNTTATTQSGSTSNTTVATSMPIWDHQSITYLAGNIRYFGSGTPAGTVNYDSINNQAIIWNTDASLDNYGGIQTPTLDLDFSKAVIFQMEVVDVYSEYIVKLAVEGESEYYYVLSDEPKTGLVSVNVVDSMLCDKYIVRGTQPDPGYFSGWKYDGVVKNCSFHILAKGPDGVKQTAELVIKSISIYNDQTAVESLEIQSDAIVGDKIERLKNSTEVQLSSLLTPSVGLNDEVIWSTDDESVATVSDTGLLSFSGVGSTYVRATSLIDQSKSNQVLVNVLSGFENPINLKTQLNLLTYGGSETDVSYFMDLFFTTWGADLTQQVVLSPHGYLDLRNSDSGVILEDYFDNTNASQITTANSDLTGDKALVRFNLEGVSSASIYRNFNGKLYKETSQNFFDVSYATYDGTFTKEATYSEQIIIVWNTGEVKKIEVKHMALSMIDKYEAIDFADSDLWTIPDRTLQTIDPVVHQLSPASLSVIGDTLYLNQNKYAEAKYCFGGIVSYILTSIPGKAVEIVLDVTGLNQMNDYVKTMWEVKIIYYHDASGTMVVSSNPLKLASGNTTGMQSIVFEPSYQYFRIYLVANGSDIGAQFAAAQIQIKSMKIQILE